MFLYGSKVADFCPLKHIKKSRKSKNTYFGKLSFSEKKVDKKICKFFFRVPIFFSKVLNNTYNFAEDTKLIRKFTQKLQLFEYLHTIFVWTAAKIVWRLVWVNQWHKIAYLVIGKAPTKFEPNKKIQIKSISGFGRELLNS